MLDNKCAKNDDRQQFNTQCRLAIDILHGFATNVYWKFDFYGKIRNFTLMSEIGRNREKLSARETMRI